MAFSGFLKKYYAEYIAFIGSLMWGLFAHGYMLTNKITSHDDLGVLYSTGAGVYNGRWMTGMFSRFRLLNMPWFNGILCLIILSLSASLIVNFIGIKKPFFAFCTGAILSTYPVVTSTFMYMFTALPYVCGFFLAVLAVWIVTKKGGFIPLQFAALCTILSLGFYQAYFSVTAGLLLINLFQYFSNEKHAIKDMIKKSLADLLLLAEGMAGYIILQKFLMQKTASITTSYQNMDQLGTISLSGFPSQIYSAYKNFFCFFRQIDPRSFLFKNIDIIILLLFVISTGCFIVRCAVGKRYCAAFFALCVSALFPLSCNLVYLYGAEEVHTLMMFGNVCTFVLFICFLHEFDSEASTWKPGKKYWKKIFVTFYCAFILFVSLSNCNTSNTVYLTQQHIINEAILYCNRMIGRIQNLPGYHTGLPICIIGRYTDETVENVDMLHRRFNIIGEDSMGQILNTVLYWDWLQENFFRVYLGFGQSFMKQEDRTVFSQKSEVRQMPDYPDDGSIAIIDDAIVVHLSN